MRTAKQDREVSEPPRAAPLSSAWRLFNSLTLPFGILGWIVFGPSLACLGTTGVLLGFSLLWPVILGYGMIAGDKGPGWLVVVSISLLAWIGIGRGVLYKGGAGKEWKEFITLWREEKPKANDFFTVFGLTVVLGIVAVGLHLLIAWFNRR